MRNIYAIVLVLISLFSLSVYGQEATQVAVGEGSIELIHVSDTTTGVSIDASDITASSGETGVVVSADSIVVTANPTILEYDALGEVETEQVIDTETAEATDAEELKESLEEVAELEEDVEDAKEETEYAKAYYFLTEKILTAEAVIAFLQENVPAVDVTPIVEYKTKIEE